MARLRKPKASEVVAAAAAAAPAPAPALAARQRYGAVRKDPAKRGRAKERQAFLAERRGSVDAATIDAAVQARRRQVAAANALRPPAGARGVPVPAEQHLWLPIGPTVVLGGQASGLPRVSGRMNDVHVSSDGQRAYAASANGGVWYSDDAGESWRPLGGWTTTAPAGTVPAIDQQSSVLTCGCMLVRFDPGGNAALDEVLVGTGELMPWGIGVPFGQNSGVGVLYGDHPATAPLFGSPWQREGNNLSGKGIFRMARDPASPTRLDAATIVAATSAGLYTRSGAPNAAWTVVPAANFRQLDGVTPLAVADDTLTCTDVCWLAGGVVFVAVSNAAAADPALYVSTAGLAGPFMPIVLAGLAQVDTNGNHAPSRLSLAPAPSDATVLYVLGSGNLVWRLDNQVPVAVQNIPPNLLGGQDDYNQAIAVHPTRPERLLLGGATELVDSQYSASLYIASVTAPAAGSWRYGFAAIAPGADPTADDSFIGSGVHADVHIARFVTVGTRNELWIGCDGGIFRSLRGNDDNRLVKRSFIARNTGLATLQCGYLATSPAADGFVVAGAQDNALLERIGVNLWRRRFIHGDAGSVAFDPAAPHRYVAEIHNAYWNCTDAAFTPPVFRAGAATVAEKAEGKETGFYTGIDAVRVPGVGAAPATSRLAIGSTRIWLTADWGATWRSLPSLGDPLAKGLLAAAQNNDTDACVDDGNVPPVRDAFRGQVLACRWASPDRLYVLCRKEVLKYELIADATVAGGLRATKTALSKQGAHKKEGRQAAATVTSPGQRLPEVGEWSDIAAHDNGRGPHGSFYVAATGDPATPTMDTLWWFDGTDRWHATGLRTDAAHPERSVPAPAYAVVVDPRDNRNTVYVGTAVGVWRGVFDPGATTWAWSPMTNGLPEAIVHDLHLHDEAATGQRLLRAAVHARGIWEVDLAQPNLQARSFVRVHDFDTRRGSPTPLTDPRSAAPASPLSWHTSPDLRVRPLRGSRPPTATIKPTATAPWVGNTPDPYGLWVFQTALHARGAGDPLVKPDGIWTPVFEARLRAANGNSNRLTRAFWNTVVGSGAAFPDAYADPWNGSVPSEADLYELIVDLPKPGGSPASIAIGRGNARVDVQVHHRHSDTLPADQVRVTLLARDVSGNDANDAAWAALPCAWTGPVQVALRAGGPLPAFGSLPALADGWRFADITQPVRNPTGPLDPRLSRVVTFDVDLGAMLGPPQVPAVPRRLMLVAVIHTQADPVDMTGGNLRAVVLANRFVAARSLEVV